MNEASKTLLINAVKEWTKFVTERERMRGIATEVSAITQRVVLESLTFLKAQNVDIECQDIETMKVMGHPVVVEPVIEAVFPSVKAKVTMTCSGANRSIVINPNASISAGGNPFMFDQFKKGVPDSFVTNAAEFVSDAFLFIARNQTPEEQAASQQAAAQQAAAQQAAEPVSPPAPSAPVAPPVAQEPQRTPPVAPQPPKPAQAPQKPVPQQPRPPQPGAPMPKPAQPGAPAQRPPQPGAPVQRPPQPGQPPKPPGQKPPGT